MEGEVRGDVDTVCSSLLENTTHWRASLTVTLPMCPTEAKVLREMEKPFSHLAQGLLPTAQKTHEATARTVARPALTLGGG